MAIATWLFAFALPVSAATTCPTPLPEIEDIAKVELSYDGKKSEGSSQVLEFALGDTIRLIGKDLETLAGCATPSKPIVVFLNNQSIGDIRPEPSGFGSAGAYTFKLSTGDVDRDKWASILGRPQFGLIKVPVSIGIEGQSPLKSAAIMHLRVLTEWRLFVWIVIFCSLLGLFIWLCGRSNIIRGEGAAVSGGDGETPAFSLSRTQAAWWFFIIIAAYILIGLVTGGYTRSINATALILLGIGSATALGATIVDASKTASPVEKQQRRQAAEKAGEQVATKEAAVRSAKVDLTNAVTDAEKTEAATRLDSANEDMGREKRALDIINNRTRGFWIDILSDANGISFHRFQNVAWTLILSVVFAKGVYHDLAMPTFDATLLGLMGLSAATYVGLKIPEATVPTKKN